MEKNKRDHGPDPFVGTMSPVQAIEQETAQ